jgi:hypothetical protein
MLNKLISFCVVMVVGDKVLREMNPDSDFLDILFPWRWFKC